MELLQDVSLTQDQAALMARGLYALSCVDGHEEREGMLIRSFWMDAVGPESMLDFKQFDTMPEVTPKDLAAGLPKADQRQMFIKTAVLLSYADGKATPPEKDWLKTCAAAFGMSEADLSRVDELVRTYLLSQLSHLDVDSLKTVAKDLGF
jgi:hypothetical protein